MDLSAAMFYKVKFLITSKDPSNDLLWKIVLHVRNWQTSKWNKNGERILPRDVRRWSGIKNGGRIITDSNIVYIESEYFSSDPDSPQFWACKITENPQPERGVAPRMWITEIGYESYDKTSAVFSCVLSYEDRAAFIGPYQAAPSASIPWLIRNIVSDPSISVTLGPDIISGKPTLLNVGDWPSFLNRIEDERRQLPYIYISPREIERETHETELLINPEELSEAVYGNALVFYSTDIGFTNEMSYMNPEYACYNGAIKVYQPGAKEAYRHHFMGAQEIDDNGATAVVGFMRRAFSQNVHFYDSFFRIEDCKKKKLDYANHLRITEQVAHYKAQLNRERDAAQEKINLTETQALEIIEEEEQQRIQAETDRDKYKALYEEEKANVYRLETQTSQMRSAMMDNESLRRSVESRMRFKERPGDALGVVTYFSEVFSDKIVFSDDALKSLKGCQIDADELWRVFYALSTVMLPLYRSNGSGDIYSTFKTQTGIECKRGEGAMTRKDRTLMKQYETSLGEETVDIEAHITYARQGQSIHFGYSKTRDRLVVGHCGEHLDNYITRRVK